MNIFEKVLELQKARETLKDLAKTKQREFEEVFSAIKERVRADRERTEKRLAELRELIQDTSKAETLRRVYAAEIEKLEADPPAPTEAEKETLKAAFAEYKKAVNDYSVIHDSLRGALSEARNEIDTIKNVREGDAPSFLKHLMGRSSDAVFKFANIILE